MTNSTTKKIFVTVNCIYTMSSATTVIA